MVILYTHYGGHMKQLFIDELITENGFKPHRDTVVFKMSDSEDWVTLSHHGEDPYWLYPIERLPFKWCWFEFATGVNSTYGFYLFEEHVIEGDQFQDDVSDLKIKIQDNPSAYDVDFAQYILSRPDVVTAKRPDELICTGLIFHKSNVDKNFVYISPSMTFYFPNDWWQGADDRPVTTEVGLFSSASRFLSRDGNHWTYHGDRFPDINRNRFKDQFENISIDQVLLIDTEPYEGVTDDWLTQKLSYELIRMLQPFTDKNQPIEFVTHSRQVRRQTKRKTGKEPSPYFTVIDTTKPRKQYTSSNRGNGASKQIHRVRGHFRHVDGHPLKQFNGTRFISPHVRGGKGELKRSQYRVVLPE